MYPEKNPQLEKIIEKLCSLLDLCCVFESQLRSTEDVKPLIIILHQGKSNFLTTETQEQVTKLFETLPLFRFRIFNLEYAKKELRHLNLFFIQHCHKDTIIYRLEDITLDEFNQDDITDKSFEIIEEEFKESLQNIKHFTESAKVNIADANYYKALECIYQYNVILINTAARFHTGDVFTGTSIKELQRLIAPFDQSLGSIYNNYVEKDLELLHIMDQLLENPFPSTTPIKEKQLENLLTKVRHTAVHVKSLFHCQFQGAKLAYFRRKDTQKQIQNHSPKEYKKIRETVQRLVDRKILELRPGHNKTYYKAHFKINGPADILYQISGILKVCIMALENEETNLFPNPNLNVQSALEHVIQLLPFEEIECLEKVIKDLEITTDHYVLEPQRFLYAS